jgi:hypothetical protein
MEVQKPWCIRLSPIFAFAGQILPIGIGKIESKDERTGRVWVRHSDQESYPLDDLCNPADLLSFATFREMVETYAKFQKKSPEEQMELSLQEFPSQRDAPS